MKCYQNPPRDSWRGLCRRAMAEQQPRVVEKVAEIIDNVRHRGDEALREYELKFTGAELSSLAVTEAEIAEGIAGVSDELKSAIKTAIDNISKFHSAQVMEPIEVVTTPGVKCRQCQLPIDRVGLYIPGGNSPLFSTVLMLAIPAKIAGCGRIVLCTPAGADGKVNPAILYAASAVGVTEIFKTGGAQAIAAMAFGTETIPAVYKIFGPGNRYVMEAKQQVTRYGVAIDMPAGPSEVMVIADDKAPIEFIAADFLSQAEHGPDSQSILLTESAAVAAALPAEIERQMSSLPKQELIARSLEHSSVIMFGDRSEMMDFANEYAPEHLIIACEDWDALSHNVRNAGSVFLGNFTPESAGDYASGTNHTLPTSSYAHSYSGVNLDSFCKKVTFQHITPEGARSLGPAVEAMARAEGLMAHCNAMALRVNFNND